MQTVKQTELRLRVGILTESQEDFLADELDAHISKHGTQTFATLLLPDSLPNSFPDLLKTLHSAGVRVEAVVQDLVTTTEIADRLEVSRQAVNNWCRGARKADAPFPEAAVISSIRLWDWGQVSRWADANAGTVDPIQYPLPDEIALLNGRLAASRLRSSGWMSASVDIAWVSGKRSEPRLLKESIAKSSKNVDFGLAA